MQRLRVAFAKTVSWVRVPSPDIIGSSYFFGILVSSPCLQLSSQHLPWGSGTAARIGVMSRCLLRVWSLASSEVIMVVYLSMNVGLGPLEVGPAM